LPVAGMMALGSAISHVTGKMMEQKQRQEELQNTIEENTTKNIDALTVNKERVEEVIGQYKNLTQAQKRGALDTESEEEYLNIQRELAELFPALISHIDSKGQAHLKSTEEIEKEIGATQKLIDLKRQEIILNSKDTFSERLKGLEQTQNAIEFLERQVENAIKKRNEYTGNDSDKITELNKEVNEAETKLL